MHEDLCAADVCEFGDFVEDVVGVERVGVVVGCVSSECAEGALCGADVCVVDVSVDDVCADGVAVDVSASCVGVAAEGLGWGFAEEVECLLWVRVLPDRLRRAEEAWVGGAEVRELWWWVVDGCGHGIGSVAGMAGMRLVSLYPES